MFAKELENIAKAMPEFVDLTQSVKNPLHKKQNFSSGADTFEVLETVTRALWFVIPFHFFAFYGLAPTEKVADTVAQIIFVGLGCLVAQMWIGSALALLPIDKSRPYKERAGLWVAGIICSWFFSVLFLSLAHTASWAWSQQAGDLFDNFDGLFYGWFQIQKLGSSVLTLAGAALGVLCLSILSRKNLFARISGTVFSNFSFLLVCFLVSVLCIQGSQYLLGP